MSIFASILRSVYKLSGAKKAFALPEDALRKEIEKQNRHRGVFTPSDRKAYYETIAVNGFPCLIVREHPKPSERAILYFFGGGMVIGPDKGDLPVMRKLCRETGCDVWFPFYPLCMEHCITETYAMVYECYRRMVGLYGGGNVSTCGFSSGGALALGIAAHNNAQPEPLPQPRHIVAVSPGEVPWNEGEKSRMKGLNERDVSIDYAFMVTVEKFMRHGCENVPDYMLSGSRGDFTGVGDIHFFYSADEVLYGALPDFEGASQKCRKVFQLFVYRQNQGCTAINGKHKKRGSPFHGRISPEQGMEPGPENLQKQAGKTTEEKRVFFHMLGLLG